MVKIEVTISDILEYIGNRSRPLKEGEAVFKAGHVILCGLEAANMTQIKSLCLQTSNLTSRPHEITIILNQNVDEWKCVCTCKAGMSGFCKHIAATLIHINRHEDLDFISCTDLEQKWGKEKKGVEETYKPKPFKEYCHPKTKKKYVFQSSAELDKENFSLLSTGVAESALTKFLSRSIQTNVDLTRDVVAEKNSNVLIQVQARLTRSNKSVFLKQLKSKILVDMYSPKPCCKAILDLLSNCNVLEVATSYKQGSSMWAKERQLRITGSTCYSIYTFSKTEDWENKSKKFFFPKHFTNKFTEHGKKYEKEALEIYTQKNNCQVATPGLLISKDFPWLGFSPDGIIFDDGGSPSKLLEIKCPFSGKTNPPETFLENCDYIDNTGSIPRLKERHSYYGQVQRGMALLDLQETKLILFSSYSKSYMEISVEFNNEFAEDLIKRISDNYIRHMLHYYCLNKDE